MSDDLPKMPDLEIPELVGWRWPGKDYQVGDRLPASWNGEPCEVEVLGTGEDTLYVKRVEP